MLARYAMESPFDFARAIRICQIPTQGGDAFITSFAWSYPTQFIGRGNKKVHNTRRASAIAGLKGPWKYRSPCFVQVCTSIHYLLKKRGSMGGLLPGTNQQIHTKKWCQIQWPSRTNSSRPVPRPTKSSPQVTMLHTGIRHLTCSQAT